MTDYYLKSYHTSQEFPDTGWLLDAPGETTPSLIRAIYAKKQLETRDDSFGIYKFADWLPIQRMLTGSCAPVTYKSEGLAAYLGLGELYITFSGYWPEKGAFMTTGSFKETEAYTVGARMNGEFDKILVVASAGNTARAFAKVCSDNNIPVLICMPEDTLDAMWFEKPVNDCVKLIVTRSGSDYFDAIHLSNLVCKLDGFIAEGGAKNVARRDGMATTMLSATTFIGRIPDYYFQAIGSGTGAIAAWEANHRLIEDGRFGSNMMKLMLSQNYPFIPMYDAWKADSRQMLALDDELARAQVMEIDAKVLSNRKPPYPIHGGLYDALKETEGQIFYASNEKAREAAQLFLELEGNDIHPAAAVATASLIEQVKLRAIDPQSVVMLNITGGGEQRFKSEHALHYMKPQLVFDIDPDLKYLAKQLDINGIG
jgi:cysteate synthase